MMGAIYLSILFHSILVFISYQTLIMNFCLKHFSFDRIKLCEMINALEHRKNFFHVHKHIQLIFSLILIYIIGANVFFNCIKCDENLDSLLIIIIFFLLSNEMKFIFLTCLLTLSSL